MKILLAVDDSRFTEKAVQFIASHLQLFQAPAELHLLHVQLPLPKGLAVQNARAILGDDALDDYYKEESQAALVPAAKLLQQAGIPFRAGFAVGDIAKELQSYAEANQIDMIVMGSHGHGALANVVLGSVATKVLAASTVPVLIVR
jgi:nucleotide-binding universal stress UspA family protein